jgi:fermentation-respiration switch protein FrsA (DUF1100 family)
MSGRKTLWRVLKWIVGIVVALLIIFFYGFCPWLLSNFVTGNPAHFRREDPNKTPAALGMKYEDIQFKSRDGIPLKGWYIPASPVMPGDTGYSSPRPKRVRKQATKNATPQPAKGTIIYCHGFHETRLEMLPEAQFGHSLGYNGLLFDFRHHGKSGGTLTSIGYWERLDAEAAVREALTQEQEHAGHPVILWGISMGAAAALMAAAEDPKVDAVVSDSTFLTFDDVIKHHYGLVIHFIRRHWWWFPPLPSFPISDEIIALSAWRAHFKPSAFNLETAVEHIAPRPILFVAVKGDIRMPPRIALTLYSLDRSPVKEVIVLPGERHGEGFNEQRAQYEAAVSKFLSEVR